MPSLASAWRADPAMLDLLAAAAHACRRRPLPPGSGEAVARLQALFAAHPATAGLDARERHRAMLLVQQLAQPGEDVAQQALADHLAARHTATLLRRQPRDIATALGSRPPTPAFSQAMAGIFSREPDLAEAVLAATRFAPEEDLAAAWLRRLAAAAGGRRPGLLRRLLARTA